MWMPHLPGQHYDVRLTAPGRLLGPALLLRRVLAAARGRDRADDRQARRRRGLPVLPRRRRGGRSGRGPWAVRLLLRLALRIPGAPGRRRLRGRAADVDPPAPAPRRAGGRRSGSSTRFGTPRTRSTRTSSARRRSSPTRGWRRPAGRAIEGRIDAGTAGGLGRASPRSPSSAAPTASSSPPRELLLDDRPGARSGSGPSASARPASESARGAPACRSASTCRFHSALSSRQPSSVRRRFQ